MIIARCQYSLFAPENANDYQQIAGKAEHRGYDDTTCREDIRIESLLRAAIARHQQITYDDQYTGNEEDDATIQKDMKDAISVVGHSGHNVLYIVGKCQFCHIVQPR